MNLHVSTSNIKIEALFVTYSHSHVVMSSAYSRIISRSNPNLPRDHWLQIAYLPYFMYGTRQEVEERLRNTYNEYLLRNCNDPAEFIQGAPNPNLFVMSYRTNDPQHPDQMTFHHIKFLRVEGRGLIFGNRADAASTFFPTVTEMAANSFTTRHLIPLSIPPQPQQQGETSIE